MQRFVHSAREVDVPTVEAQSILLVPVGGREVWFQPRRA